MSAEVIVAAQGSVPASVLARAHYVVAAANNGTAVSAVNSTAADTISAALAVASPGTSVRTVGDFYLTEPIIFEQTAGMTLDGLGSRFFPADAFPTNNYMIEVGQHDGAYGGSQVVNVTIDGRAGSGSGGETHFRSGATISKMIHGINFASNQGNIDKVKIYRLTGHAIRLGHPTGSAGGNTDSIFSRIVMLANLGGGLFMAGDHASVDMHITNVRSRFGGYYSADLQTFTLVKQNIDGLWGNPTSLQITASDFDWNTGSGYRITSAAMYSKIIGCKFRYNGTSSTTRGGGIYSDSGAPDGHLIENCMFLGGYGTQLYVPDFGGGLVLAGLLFDPSTPTTVGGAIEDGAADTAARAINANSSGKTVVASGIRVVRASDYSSSALVWPASAELGAISTV